MNNNIGLCFLQETFMTVNDEAIVNEVREMGMKMYSIPREHGEHGGLGLIYNPCINIKLVSKTKLLKYKTFEYSEFTLRTVECSLRFCNVYRRPYSEKHRFTITQFLTEFDEYLTALVDKPGLPVILGDLNIHLEKLNDAHAIILKDMFDQFNFTRSIHEYPYTQKLGGQLDVIFYSEAIPSSFSKAIVYPDGTQSDHYMVSCSLQCKIEKKESTTVENYRNFKSIDIDKFKIDLKASPLCKTVTLPECAESISIIANMYNDELAKLMDKHCPILQKKKKSTNKTRDAWFDRELQELLRKCRAAERKYYKSNHTGDKNDYKQLSKLYTSTLKKKRKDFHSNDIMNAKNDKRKLFNKLNKLLGKEKSFLPDCNDDKQLSEDFASYFTSKINKIRYDIESEKADYGMVNDIPVCDDCVYRGSALINFNCLSQDQLKNIFSAMSDKFCSLDPIPTWLLRSCFDELGPVLLKLINLSLKLGIFPESFKHAIIKPTIKDPKESKDALSNYRPVSNIPFISKLLEKVVLGQLNEHLSVNNLYCTSQSGYQRFHSCETLNIKMFNDILKSIDEGSTVSLLLLDMSAAFDTVDHTLLLQLLNTDYGLDGTVLKWLEDYLDNRKCSVSINNSFSDILCLLFGVPQGSILGPILFILYTKHLQHIAMKHGLFIQLYADDTQIYIAFKNDDNNSINNCKERIENCLKEIKTWMCCKYLKLNEGKTKLLLLCKPSLWNSTPSDFSLGIFSSTVEEFDWMDDVKSLGVYLDPNLKMDKQIRIIKKYCYGQLASWKRITSFLTEDVRVMLVQQVILSKLIITMFFWLVFLMMLFKIFKL